MHLHIRRSKLKAEGTQSDSNFPSQNPTSSMTSDSVSQSNRPSSPAVPKDRSFRKRAAQKLRHVFHADRPASVTGSIVISSTSTRPTSVAEPFLELEAEKVQKGSTKHPALAKPIDSLSSTTKSSLGPGAVATTPRIEPEIVERPLSKPHQQIKLGSTIIHGAKTALDIATESADALPQLKSVLGGIRAIIKLCEVSSFLKVYGFV